MIEFKERDGEDRKTYLVRVAIVILRTNAGYNLPDDVFIYDGAECDMSCLSDDLQEEFDMAEV